MASPPESPRRKLPKAKAPAVGKTSKPQDNKLKNNAESPESKAAEKVESAFEKKIGFSAESLKVLLTAKDPTPQIVKLKELLGRRCIDGRTFALRDWRVHAAEDEAYNAPFRQISPTLINKIMSGDRRLTVNEIEDELTRWGLPETGILTTITSKNPDGKTVKEKIITRDTFSVIRVPIAKAMTNAREARLFAERDNEPFMSFEPVRSTEEWQVIGEIITKLVSQMSTTFGHKATYRGLNHQALKSSCGVMFPQEVWYSEDDYDSAGEKFTAKEGLRYNIPPITRTFWDQTHRPATLNSDTGCKWAGYYRLAKFSDVDQNPAYYNKDSVSYSATNWVGPGSAYETYFRYVYPCTVEMPVMPPNQDGKDREANASLYSTGDLDKPIFVTEMFCKLSPKDWGISEYKPEVWIRFVMASDRDAVYAEPFPYSPALYKGTDAEDATSNSTASFTLETIPWQDLIGNVLSDILNGMKQNSIKVILYDKYQITEDKIEEMMARARESGSAVWFPMDWKELMRGQVNPDMLFKPFTFPQQTIGEKIATLNTVFNVMERGLGISAQETGAIAGHIQTKTEIDTISSNVGSRLGLILSMDDDFFDAWKRQIFKAMQAFMDEDFAVDVSAVSEELVAKMKKDFGFEFESIGKDTMHVKGKKSKLSVDAFLSSREGRTRQNNPQVAQVMFQSIAAIAANPNSGIGKDQIIKMWNDAMHLAGAPEYAKWKIDPEQTALMEQKKLAEMIDKFSKQILQQAQAGATTAATQGAIDAVGKQVGPAIQQVGQAAAQAGQGVQQVAGEVTDLKAHTEQIAQLVVRIDNFIKAAQGQQPTPPIQPQPQLPLAA